MSTRAERAARLRPIVLQLLDRHSLQHVASMLDVSVGAIRNLKAGSTPQEDTIDRIERAAQAAGLLDLSTDAGEEDGQEALRTVILKRDDVVRMLGALAPEGEAQDLKADQLQLIRQAYMRMGLGMPSWWYDLLQAVDAGEI
jgi:hypothetical protein